MKITFYERACSGCAKARSFLTKRDVNYESLDVRKKPIAPKEAFKLARRSKRIVGVMGKKIVSYDLKSDKPSDPELEKILIGRSGVLRAPCIQTDEFFIGGFNPEIYREVLKL